MKKLYLPILTLLLFAISSSPVFAGNFTDDFNDGNADGWFTGPAYATAPPDSNYRVENGVVVQDFGRDGYMFLKDGLTLTDQSLQANVLWHDNGDAGLALWYLNADNWVKIQTYRGDSFMVGEKWCEISPCGRDTNYSYVIYPHTFAARDWQRHRVEANSETGEIKLFVDDELILSHIVGPNVNREGLSGFVSSNAGGSFDNYLVSWPDPTTSPTNKDQCKKNGWKEFENPTFKSQGACISYVLRQQRPQRPTKPPKPQLPKRR